MEILITGAAGFIGFHLVSRLLKEGKSVLGIDNLNPYYDVNLKKERIKILKKLSGENKSKFKFLKCDLENKTKLEDIFNKYNPDIVINLAAQAGVRYSLKNPFAYINSNLVGFANIIDISKNNMVKHFIYASSSSVYGGNETMPFQESHNVDHPISLYAATKKSNELLAHSYSHIFNLPTTGLRFFTVYGPWGRPDMALFLFTRAILEGHPIKIYNNGEMARDFTYIDDIIESIYRLIYMIPSRQDCFNKKEPDPSESWAPYKIFNIGNNKSTPLMKYIEILEDILGIQSKKDYMPLQLGDVIKTYADTSKLNEWVKFKPDTDIRYGIRKFVEWFKIYYKI